MSSNRFTKLLILALSVIFLSVVSPPSSARAQILDLDITAVNPQFANAFERAEAFWNARVLGYSNTLPRDIQAQLTGRLSIMAATGLQNSPELAGALGRAGPVFFPNIVRGTAVNRRQIAVPTIAVMIFADEFLADNSEDDITDVIIHEMGHAIGVGSLWEENGLLQQIGPGPLQYIGAEGRRAFAIETGVAGLARTAFVPIEQQGGGGTALAHWDDDNPFFNSIGVNNRIELMTGFFIPDTERFISRTTLATLVDMGYVIRGFNEDELIEFPGLGTRPFGIPSFGGTGVAINDPVPAQPTFGDDDDDGAINAGTTFSSSGRNPSGANQSGTTAPRKTLNVYKRRRR